MGDIKDIGGLWKKTSKKGKKYLSGLDLNLLQGLDPNRWNIMIFPNEKKEEEKQPDFNVVALERDPKFQKKSSYKPEPKVMPSPSGPVNPWDSDDPF